MIIPDSTVLIQVINADSPNHRTAFRWWADLTEKGEPVGLAWNVVLSFLQLSTKPGIFPRPLETHQAWNIVEVWQKNRCCQIIAPGRHHFRIFKTLVGETNGESHGFADLHLAALVIEHGGELHSTNTHFGRIPSLRWKNPLAQRLLF